MQGACRARPTPWNSACTPRRRVRAGHAWQVSTLAMPCSASCCRRARVPASRSSVCGCELGAAGRWPGRDISPWHDIPLYLDSGLVSFVCEIPKETSAKMEVATVRRPARHLLLRKAPGDTSEGAPTVCARERGACAEHARAARAPARRSAPAAIISRARGRRLPARRLCLCAPRARGGRVAGHIKRDARQAGHAAGERAPAPYRPSDRGGAARPRRRRRPRPSSRT